MVARGRRALQWAAKTSRGQCHTLEGNPKHTVGELPKVGSLGSNFRLTRGDLGNVVALTISRYLPFAQKRFWRSVQSGRPRSCQG